MALLLSAERGSLWIIPSRPKDLSSFQFFYCFWLFHRPSMDRRLRPLRLPTLNKSRLCKRSWMPCRARWEKFRTSYNDSPVELLRPLTCQRTLDLQSLPSNKTKSPRPRRN